MWYETENGENIRPSAIDSTSSKVYTYFRKNIEAVPEKGKEGEEDYIPAHYKWLETKVHKEVAEFVKKTYENESAINDVNDALVELAEMIVEITEG